MKKILFLTTQLPYPPFSGGAIKSYRLTEFLAKEYELHVVSALKNDDRDHSQTFVEKVNPTSFFGKDVDVARNPVNLLKSYLLSETLNIYRNRHLEIQKEVEKLAPEMDIIFVDHYEMYPYVPSNFQGKVILHQHNAEYVMWERLAELEKNPLKRALIQLEAWRIRRAERRFCLDADLVYAAPNDIDQLTILGVSSDKFKETYHLGEDEMLELPALQFKVTEKALLFVGTLTWEANVDGLVWFFEECWEDILKRQPEVKCYVVGKRPDERIQKCAEMHENIILTGFVEDLEPYHTRSRVFIVPLRFGSGIKVKLLNSMYRGIPAVTTTIGIEGLEVENGKDLYFSDDAQGFVESVDTLLSDERKWQEVSANAREVVREKYTWNTLLENLKKDLGSLL